MIQVSAAEVQKLRKMTGAGMMDCKKALEEADGDYEKAVETIRKKGQLVAAKRADRVATEGVVLSTASSDGKSGVLICLSSETDFVAKNSEFIGTARAMLEIAISNKPATLEALLALPMESITVGEKVLEKVAVIGEKVELSVYEKLDAEKVIAYIHPGNKLATLVGFNKAGLDEQIYKDIAMQVAAMAPVAVDKADVPAEKIAKEREIALEQTHLDKKNEGKPANILEKIAEGKLEKFLKENTLVNQEFIKDGKINVGQYLQSKDKELKVTGFRRFTLVQ
jgi:elongation factor Ts